MTATVQLPPDGQSNYMPPYCAWVDRLASHSYEPYYPESNDTNIGRNLGLATLGVTGCNMGIIDQGLGLVTITGVTYGKVDSHTAGGYDWLIAPADLAMVYRVVDAVQQSGVESNGVQAAVAPTHFMPIQNPLHFPAQIQYYAGQSGRISITLFDVIGRRRAQLADVMVGRGLHSLSWSGADDTNERVSSGVY